MKFINNTSNKLEEEIKNIELLKQRFGENKLNTCMILVKDVKESQKLSKAIAETIGFPLEFNVLIMSKEYWPIQREEEEEEEYYNP